MQYRFGGSLAKIMAKPIGLKKHCDSIAIFFTLEGEPMHEFAPPNNPGLRQAFLRKHRLLLAPAGRVGKLPPKAQPSVMGWLQ
jgi:hypothetical protein